MPLTELPFNLPGRVYRSCMPGSRTYDVGRSVLPAAERAEISVVVILADAEECATKSSIPDLRSEYRQRGWSVLDSPIPDYDVPQAGFASVVRQALELARGGKNLLVHCHAGIGRTGTFLACLRRAATGESGEQAIAYVRRSIPSAVETEEQRAFVRSFLERAGERA